MDEIIEKYKLILKKAENLADQLSNEEKQLVLELLTKIAKKIKDKQAELLPQNTAPSAPEPIAIAPEIQMLWRIANGHVPAFVNYLSTYPSPEINALAANTGAIDMLVNRLRSMNLIEEQPAESGLPAPTYFSSNVTGVQYDPKSKKLMVSFFREGGPDSVYQYDNVPRDVYHAVRDGRGFARTRGKNSRGSWWPGKSPSTGASLNTNVKEAGYNYQRLR